ncbi:MAG: post-PEP-CTERM-1 domain-containing protein [Massilia sp.]
MSNKKLIKALPLAALCAAATLQVPPASAAGQDGMVVVRDPQTGQMRTPTAAEMQALRQQPAAAVRGPGPSAPFTRPNGTRVVQLGERGMVYEVATRDAQGKLVRQCVQGERAAVDALAQPIAAANPGEHRHEDR